MRLVIITGLSGAGKSQALHCMEDMGYYCVDNLPPAMIQTFVDLCKQRKNGFMDSVAIGIDIRGRDFFDDIDEALKSLKQQQVEYEVVFLDAEDEVLIKRYKETRRIHPLGRVGPLLDGILRERELMQNLKEDANYVIDTSFMQVRDLKSKILEIFTKESVQAGFPVTVRSFGYKWGNPSDADLIIDVRFINNPFYVDELKCKTGKDPEVKDYVMSFKESAQFLERFNKLLSFLIPQYISEGKGQLVVGVGCTGGVHRSVVLAEEIGKALREQGFLVMVEHRDIQLLKTDH